MLPGIYSNLSNGLYHSSPGISKSGLDQIAKSPLHYWAAYLDPDRKPREPNPAMVLGTAVHAAILEPEKFDEEYFVAPKIDRRTKEGKELAARIEADAQGKIVIDQEQHDRIMRIVGGAHAHRHTARLLNDGMAEQSVFWTDEETGVLCKVRPDWLSFWTDEDIVICDVKTTSDASSESFCRSAFRYKYFVQAAFYMDGVEAVFGRAPKMFAFLAVETDAPYASAWYFADQDMIAAGRLEYRKHLRRYAECLNAGNWPGYSDKIEALGMPRWFNIMEEE